MEVEKQNYEKIVSERKVVLEELRELSQNEIVKRYLELIDKNDELEEKEEDSFVKMKAKSYKDCHHLTIYSKIYQDASIGKTYRRVGCIKCGADTGILDIGTIFLTKVEKAMYDYLNSYSNVFFNSKPTYTCDLDLACAIYAKILEHHPRLDDRTAKKYFEIALDNMRNIPTTEQRRKSRIKRLSLKENFNKWNIEDVTE